MATLTDSLELILAQVQSDLEAAIASDEGTIAGDRIEKVIRGDRFRGTPVPAPSIWIEPGIALFTRDTYSDEAWELPIKIASLVRGTPDEAGPTAARVTANAQRIAINIAPEGVALTDVVSDQFDPTTRSNPDNKTLFWVVATVKARFSVDDGRQ